MTSYLLLYILISVFCTILVLILAFHSRIGMGALVAQRCFALTIYVFVVFFLTDAVWYAMDCGALPQVWLLSMMLKSIYFLSATMAGYAWLLFANALIDPKRLSTSRGIRLSAILLLIHLVLCVINFFNPILFGLEEDFTYFRGPLFAIQYIFVYAYLVMASGYALIQAFLPRNHLNRTRYIIIALFPIAPAISGILQLFFWRIPFNCMAFTLGIIVVYLTELGEQISQEPLSQLANRKQFMRALEQSVDNYHEGDYLYLYMVDVDRFKIINDTFGHVEGDAAIVRVSKALKMAASHLSKRAILARYGGDEFAIIRYAVKPLSSDMGI